MEEIHATICIDFENGNLSIAEECSSGCTYNVENKQDLFDYILGYIMDIVDTDKEFDFKTFKK